MSNTAYITPTGELDYGFDWSDWLGTDTIASSSWAVSNTDAATVSSSTYDDDGTTAWLSGGTADETAIVTNTITTTAGRTTSRSFVLRTVASRFPASPQT